VLPGSLCVNVGESAGWRAGDGAEGKRRRLRGVTWPRRVVQLFSQFFVGRVWCWRGNRRRAGSSRLRRQCLLKVVVVLLPQFSVPTESDISLKHAVAASFSVTATILAGVLVRMRGPAAGRFRAGSLSENAERGRQIGFPAGGRNGFATGAGRRRSSRLALTLLGGRGDFVIHSFWKLTAR